MYIEQLGKVDLNVMYKITTQERLLQNLVKEYEKFVDLRLVLIRFFLTYDSQHVHEKRGN